MAKEKEPEKLDPKHKDKFVDSDLTYWTIKDKDGKTLPKPKEKK